jgi:flagellum-specific peptidoglycan hydrolase FlgJ
VGVLQLPEQQQQLEQMQLEQWQQQQQEQWQLAHAAAASSDSAVNSSEEDLQAAAAAALPSSNSNSSSSSTSSSKLSDWQLQRASNPMSLSGSSFVGALTRSAQLGGQSGLLLRLLIAGQARKAAGGLWCKS